MYFHPKDRERTVLLNSLLNQAWKLGMAKASFSLKTKYTDEIKVEGMTEWELKYIFLQDSTQYVTLKQLKIENKNGNKTIRNQFL